MSSVLRSRSVCVVCGKTRKLYCYSPGCLSAVSPLPHLDLPIRLAVAHHREEHLSKSTAVHAKVLAPECVDFYYDDRVSDMPVFSAEDTLALFPSEHASTCEQLGKDKLRKFKRIVVIEGTWVKAAAAVKRANVEHLQHVRLKDYETSFWRYQRKGKEKDTSKLSSIEAIYYFYKEYIEIVEGSYDGRVDDLLYIFKGMKKLIEQKE